MYLRRGRCLSYAGIDRYVHVQESRGRGRGTRPILDGDSKYRSGAETHVLGTSIHAAAMHGPACPRYLQAPSLIIPTHRALPSSILHPPSSALLAMPCHAMPNCFNFPQKKWQDLLMTIRSNGPLETESLHWSLASCRHSEMIGKSP